MTPETSEEKKSAVAPREPSKECTAFAETLKGESEPEKRIRMGLDFMREALNLEAPRFRDFWDSRRMTLALFSEKISAQARVELWNEFVDLSASARKLKEIKEEESAFAVEQINLALTSIEQELQQYEALLANLALPELPQAASVTGKVKELYAPLQKELAFLSTYTAKLSALRQEVLKTSLRMRKKNELLDRVTRLGEVVFPKRRELIDKLSQEFTSDVERFVERHFSKGEPQGAPLFTLRDEIKALQAFAKELALTPAAFMNCRTKLSECWERLKEREKVRKREIAEKRQVERAQTEEVRTKIQAFHDACRAEGALYATLERDADALRQTVRRLDVERDERRALDTLIEAAFEPLVQVQRAEEEARVTKRREEEAAKRKAFLDIKEKLAELFVTVESDAFEEVAAHLDKLKESIEALEIPSVDRERLFLQLKRLNSSYAQRKRKALLAASPDRGQALEEWRALLEQLNEEKRSLRDHLEELRRASSASSLDFEKSLSYQELIDEEKERLQRVLDAADEAESKISELESG